MPTLLRSIYFPGETVAHHEIEELDAPSGPDEELEFEKELGRIESAEREALADADLIHLD